jgi:hypothetical protein
MIFDHWEEMEGEAMEEGSRVWETIAGVRQRKGLDRRIPDISHFIDRL